MFVPDKTTNAETPDLLTFWKPIVALAGLTASLDLLHLTILHWLGLRNTSVPRALLLNSIWWITYIGFLSVAIFLARRLPLVASRHIRTIAIHTVSAVVLAYTHGLMNAWLALRYSGLSGKVALRNAGNTFRGSFPIEFISYWTIVWLVYAIQLQSSAHKKQLDEAKLIARTEALQASLTSSRLQALRSQLNPHFLFNTLSALSTLVLKGELNLANQVISRLAKMLRYTLDDTRPQLISLSKDLAFLDIYIDIQLLMLSGRLRVTKAIDPDALTAFIPGMILQPIVENSIVHGIASQERGGEISIRAFKSHDWLNVIIADTGPGFSSVQGRGIGLSNTAQRLQQLYGNDFEFDMHSGPAGGAVVTVKVPFQVADAD